MNHLQFARIIALMYLSLEIDEDQVIDADDAVEITENLLYLLGQLDKEYLRELAAAFPVIAKEWPEESQEYVRTIPDDFDLDDDDPSV